MRGIQDPTATIWFWMALNGEHRGVMHPVTSHEKTPNAVFHLLYAPSVEHTDPGCGPVIQILFTGDMFDAVARALCCEARTTSSRQGILAGAVRIRIPQGKVPFRVVIFSQVPSYMKVASRSAKKTSREWPSDALRTPLPNIIYLLSPFAHDIG